MMCAGRRFQDHAPTAKELYIRFKAEQAEIAKRREHEEQRQQQDRHRKHQAEESKHLITLFRNRLFDVSSPPARVEQAVRYQRAFLTHDVSLSLVRRVNGQSSIQLTPEIEEFAEALYKKHGVRIRFETDEPSSHWNDVDHDAGASPVSISAVMWFSREDG